VFADCFAKRISPAWPASQGFRPLEGAGKATAPIECPAHGADPQPRRPAVAARPAGAGEGQETWPRRPQRRTSRSSWTLSGSMSEENSSIGQAWVCAFFPVAAVAERPFRPDHVQRQGSSASTSMQHPSSRAGKRSRRFNGLFPTARPRSTTHRRGRAGGPEAQGRQRINAVVVLTDGDDNQSPDPAPATSPVGGAPAPGTSEGMAIRV